MSKSSFAGRLSSHPAPNPGEVQIKTQVAGSTVIVAEDGAVLVGQILASAVRKSGKIDAEGKEVYDVDWQCSVVRVR